MRVPSFKQLLIGLVACFGIMLFAGAASISTAQAEPSMIVSALDVTSDAVLANSDILQPGFFVSEDSHNCSQACHHNQANLDIDADATRTRAGNEAGYHDISPAMLRAVFTVKHDRHFEGVLSKVPWDFLKSRIDYI